MKRTREQIKAELMKKAEQEIDRLLDWEEQANKPTLTQFENQVLMRRKALSEAMLDGVMAGQETRPPTACAPRRRTTQPTAPPSASPLEARDERPRRTVGGLCAAR